MIPMIDLLMVTISFLLITAVWSQYQRMEASGQAPGTATAPCDGDCKEEPKLHIETADPARFVLAWKQGRTVLRTAEVTRESKAALTDLAAKVEDEWRSSGSHHEAIDRSFDHAVVHAANDMPYAHLIAVMDAVARSKRPYASAGKVSEANAFEVTLASD